MPKPISQTKSSLPPADKAALALNAEGKATNVTPQNFGWLFRCFVVNKGQNKDFLGQNINPIDHASQWGAWRAYRIAKGMTTYAMDQIGKRLAELDKPSRLLSMVGYLVPADWPADFDADYPPENDRYAADRFVNAQNKKRDEVRKFNESTSAEERAQHVKEALRRLHGNMSDPIA